MGPRAKAKATAAVAEDSQQAEPARKRARTRKTQAEAAQVSGQQQAPAKPAKASTKARRAAADTVASRPAKQAARAANTIDAAGGDKGAQQQCYYLVKSEPHEFSVEQLEAKTNQTEGWEGVRNAQARNFLKAMRVGDLAFFYHSSCKVPGIVGIAEVVREAYPDATQFDSSSKYHDPKSSEDKPKWWQVDFQLVRKLSRQITLEELKGHKDGALAGMALFNRPRLSVQPVTQQQWEFVLSLEDQEPAGGS